MAYITKTFPCCSGKCLNDEAGAAALIDTFEIGMGDSMPCRGKMAPYLEETCFLFWFLVVWQGMYEPGQIQEKDGEQGFTPSPP